MPFVAAAVCPAPPLLVPEIAAGAADELDALRDACREALGAVRAAEPELLVVVGSAVGDEPRGTLPEGAVGSLRPFGVDREIRLSGGIEAEGGESAALPRSLTVGAWLLGECGWFGPVLGVGVDAGAATADCLAIGAELAETAGLRVALLVLGDGSACRSLKAPGYLDPRAEGYDAAVAAALASADTEALAALDPALADELRVEGRAPWQVLAGAARATGADGSASVSPLTGRLLYDEAPYGVGYFVAAWTAPVVSAA